MNGERDYQGPLPVDHTSIPYTYLVKNRVVVLLGRLCTTRNISTPQSLHFTGRFRTPGRLYYAHVRILLCVCVFVYVQYKTKYNKLGSTCLVEFGYCV